MKRKLCLILTAALLLTLAACTSEDQSSETLTIAASAQPQATASGSSSYSQQELEPKSLDYEAASGETAYKSTRIWDGLTLYNLYVCDDEPYAITNESGYAQLIQPDNGDKLQLAHDSNVSELDISGNGVYFTSVIWGEVLDSAETFLTHLTIDGQELSRWNLADYEWFEDWYGEQSFVNSIKAFGNGLICLSDSMRYIIIDSSCGFVCEGEFSGGADFHTSTEGVLYVSYYDEKGTVIKCFDESALEFINCATLVSTEYMLYGGNEAYPVLCTNQLGLYGLDLNSSQLVELINWASYGIVFEFLTEICPVGDGFVCMDGLGNPKYYRLQQCDPSEASPRKVITYGTFGESPNLSRPINSFNTSNNEYYIEVVDYCQGGLSYSEALTRLHLALITGNGPDLLELESSDLRTYANKGVLLDLYRLIDDDPDISRDDFFGLDKFEVDGNLYAAPESYQIWTAYGQAAVFGDAKSWTLDDFLAMQDNLPEGQIMNGWVYKTNLLEMLLNTSMNRLVDWSTGACYFEGDEFVTLLEKVNQCRETYHDWEGRLDRREWEDLASGKIIYETCYVNSVYGFYSWAHESGVPMTCIGLPTVYGDSGSVLESWSMAGINAQSEEIEGAWAFIKYLISSEDCQDGLSIPVLKSAIEKEMKDMLDPMWMYEGKEIVAGDNGGFYVDGVFYDSNYDPTPIITEDEVQAFYDFVESAVTVSRYEVIKELILEEAEDFFYGMKTATQIAAIIQNRVEIYMAENN